MKAILLMFHVEMGTGYAIEKLCSTFLQMAEILVRENSHIHVSFTRVSNLKRSEVLTDIAHIIEFNPWSHDRSQYRFIMEYVKTHQVDVVFGFDLPAWLPSYKHISGGGVKTIVSYQGAPMSSLNQGIKLMLKKIEIMLRAGTPDHYIFESIAMAETAYLGRGIPESRVSVINLGVDTEKYKPIDDAVYTYKLFSIPVNRKIIYYSGHMEKRKGVDVLVKAAKHLYNNHNRRDFHFLIMGNREGEEQEYLDFLRGSKASDHVTFGGYRNDIEKIIPNCYLGVIASTGWDSFTMSSLEIAASGLPLLVSRLQGLVETIDEGKTGHSFEPGSYRELSNLIIMLFDNQEARDLMGVNARRRILSEFTVRKQIERLVLLVKQVTSSKLL